jgi:hypothetical protein
MCRRMASWEVGHLQSHLTFEDGATLPDHQNNRVYTQSAKSGNPLWVLPSAASLTKKSIEETNILPQWLRD